MARLALTSVISLALLLPTALALPPFWPHGYNNKPFPILTIASSEGIYPTGLPGSTGTATDTGSAYYPTATGSAYITKRDANHPFGYPAPFPTPSPSSPIVSGQPTGSSPLVFPTYTPTGSAPSASGTGTGLAYPTYTVADKRDIDAAHEIQRHHFEGPRKRDMKPYYPFARSPSYDGGAGATATAPSGGPTGTSVPPVSLPLPTGTVVIPSPMPTGFPTASGTVGGGYYTMMR